MNATVATCTVGYVVAWTVVVHGLVNIVEHLNALVVCRACVTAHAVEVGVGITIFSLLLAITGGFFE